MEDLNSHILESEKIQNKKINVAQQYEYSSEELVTINLSTVKIPNLEHFKNFIKLTHIPTALNFPV